MLRPDQFIPVAEETGLIGSLGRLVLREACRQLAAWRRGRRAATLRMNVNISGRQLLDPGFLGEVDRGDRATTTCRPTRCGSRSPRREAAADYAAVGTALATLLEQTGVRAHLDDFGTGTSSLTFLRRFPGDALKIDRSFVQAMGNDEGAFQIVKAILALAHNMGMEVVAEGVETPWHLEHAARAWTASSRRAS